jgi:hypothetical protein
MHTSGPLHRIVHELDVAHFPVIIAQEFTAKGDSVGDVGESKDNCAVLKSNVD